MIYDNEKKSFDKKNRFKELCKLWVKSANLHEFLVNADLEIPEATKYEMLAFKLWYFKKRHPIIWFTLWFMWSGVLAFLSFLSLGVFHDTWFGNMFLVFPVVWFLGMYLYIDEFQRIAWYESGCPIHY